MTLDPVFVGELLALGCTTGFLAGLLGIGGGMLLVPFLTLILTQRGVGSALAVKMAIATSMATILFTSISSVRAHHAHGAVRWPLARAMAPGIVAGGLAAGAGAFALFKGQWLALIFAVFVGFSATQMLFGRQGSDSRALPGALGLGSAGAAIGFVSGLVGAGGGFICVPFLATHGVILHEAIATSAALGFPIALANTVGYIVGGWNLPDALPGSIGYLYFPALACTASGSVVLAPLGARVAHQLDVRQLRRLFAMLLYGLALYMLTRGLAPA